jgi:transposase
MAQPILPDELWKIIEPLLPAPKKRRFKYPGRKPVTHRQALTGILFVLRSGIPWHLLPQEMGCGSGVSCWRRLRDWQRAGVWKKLHEILLAFLQAEEKIDWSRAVVDSAFCRALGGGEKTGPNPTDRAKPGSKHHVITNGNGIPLATELTAANVNDVTQLLPLIDAIPPVSGKLGRPRSRPDAVLGDRAYSSEDRRKELRQRNIVPVIGRPKDPHGSGLGQLRWVVERTLAWFHQFRKLRLRTEKQADLHEAFVLLACAMISWNFLKASF